LREVKKPNGDRVLFAYDAFGRRVRKEVLPGENMAARRVVEFVWDGDELASERDTSRGERIFVHEPGTFVPMLQVEQGEVFVVVNDHLGMPKELIDRDGKVVWSAAYSAWGRVLETSGDPSRKGRPIESPFRLLGQYADDETGLCYTRFRYFDAETGRWCSPDPLGIVGGTNLHGFGAAPTTTVDCLGLACKIVYRVIRASENPELGLFAKNMTANHMVEGHILHGSKPNFASQFISTTKDLSVAKKWAQISGNRIVKIDLSKVSSEVIDLTDVTLRNTLLKGVTSRAWASASSEVLVLRSIPAEAIKLLP